MVPRGDPLDGHFGAFMKQHRADPFSVSMGMVLEEISGRDIEMPHETLILTPFKL